MMKILKKIQLSNEGFTGDSGDFTQINPDSPPYNHGLKVCHQWFKDFAVVEFVGPLWLIFVIKID